MDSYLSWLSAGTPTRWWHDSARPQEIDAAIENGALGVTTNPILTYKTLQQDADFWRPVVEGIPEDARPQERAEALLGAVARYAAGRLMGVYKQTGHAHGYALAQVNPEHAGDGAAMLAQALRFAAWGENIAVKLPTTRAALPVIEELAARGVAVCTTLNFTAAQAIAAAEAYERGARRLGAAGAEVKPCFVVQQGGRLCEYLEDCARDGGIFVDEGDLRSAGNIVTKHVYDIFCARGCRAKLMPAGLRAVEHLTRFAGADMVFSLQTRVQEMVRAANPERVEHIDEADDPRMIERLMKIPEFARAYESDGLAQEEFISFGLTQRTLSQFLWTGWSPLETYGGAPGDRWF